MGTFRYFYIIKDQTVSELIHINVCGDFTKGVL
jgi:hypothetical protein